MTGSADYQREYADSLRDPDGYWRNVAQRIDWMTPPTQIRDPIADCRSKLIITADEGLRGGKRIALKANVDAALALPGTNSVETVLVVRHTGAAVAMQMPRDRWVDVVVEGQPDTCEPEPM